MQPDFNNKKSIRSAIGEELAELEESNAWAKEMYDIWMREDREIKEIIGS